eukprot:s694_g28.t7
MRGRTTWQIKQIQSVVRLLWLLTLSPSGDHGNRCAARPEAAAGRGVQIVHVRAAANLFISRAAAVLSIYRKPAEVKTFEAMDKADFSMEDLKDPERLKFLLMKYAKTEAFKVWGGFFLVSLTVFMLFSSGDFSFLLTLSSLVSVFSFLMVALKIEAGRSCKGVSLRMMECYLAIFFFRYLPFDKSGDWFYQTCEALGFCLAGTMVYFCRFRYAASYDPSTDNFQHHWLALGAAGLSLIFHPNLNNFLPSDISWAFALYLESVAVLCQLFMFMKEGQAAPHTSHFLAAQALAKIMSFIFWASSFNELSNPNHTIKAFVGNWVVCTQLVQLLVMGDFIYHYIRCIRQGIPVSQLLCSDNELRELCKEHGLSHVGKKGEMVERLVAFRGGEAAVADRLLAKSPKAKATASPQGRGGGRTKGRSAAVPMVKSSPSGGSQTTGPALSCGLLRKPNLLPSPVPGASLWAASRQQLLRCGRCQALYDLGNARYSASPESFWCPVCRFKVMDPFNSVVVPDGVLKHQLVTEPHFDFSLELPHLRQWRREGKAVEVRMLRVESTKVEQVWPRAIHFFANGVEVSLPFILRRSLWIAVGIAGEQLQGPVDP